MSPSPPHSTRVEWTAAPDPSRDRSGLCRDGPIRVLYVTDHLGYENGSIHGVTTYLLTTLTAFDRRRVEGHLCVLRPHHPVAERFEAAGIHPVFLGLSKWDPRALTPLLRLVREESIDVLHLGGHKSLALGRIAARLAHRQAIIHLHDTDRLEPGLRVLQRRMANWTFLALAVSPPVRQAAIEDFGMPPERVEVLPNPVCLEVHAHPSLDARSRIRRDLQLHETTPLVAVMGRLIPGKGQAELIQAMPEILACRPGTVLVVIGEGPMRGRCETLSRSLGLEGSVRFTGQREDVPEILAAVDVVVVPSTMTEGFGYSALEANAAGRPVVAFASGALPFLVVDGETGLLVPVGDVPALAAAVCRVLQDQTLARRLGAAARHHAQSFAPEAHVRRLEEIYTSALACEPDDRAHDAHLAGQPSTGEQRS